LSRANITGAAIPWLWLGHARSEGLGVLSQALKAHARAVKLSGTAAVGHVHPAFVLLAARLVWNR